MPRARRAVGRGQDERAAHRGRAAAPGRGARGAAAARCGSTPRAASTCPERRRCGYLFQEYALFGHLSAWRNVAYALHELPRAEREARRPRAARALRARRARRRAAGDAVGRGAPARRARRALARAPAALLLDEPLSALDARTRAPPRASWPAVIRDAGVPVLLVTHDFAEAALLGDRVAVMDGGRVLQTGTASALAAAPASAFVADFTGAVVLTGDARARTATLVALDGGGELPRSRATGPDGSASTRGRSRWPRIRWQVALVPGRRGPPGRPSWPPPRRVGAAAAVVGVQAARPRRRPASRSSPELSEAAAATAPRSRPATSAHRAPLSAASDVAHELPAAHGTVRP